MSARCNPGSLRQAFKLKKNPTGTLLDIHRNAILSDSYDKNSSVEVTDDNVITVRYGSLVKDIENKDLNVGEKKFLPFFTNKLLPLLRGNFIEPVRLGKVTTFWTNNNCGSAKPRVEDSNSIEVSRLVKIHRAMEKYSER